MKKILIALAMAGCAGMGAHAATVSYDFNLPIQQQLTDFETTDKLNLFNSILGTLTGANLEIFGAVLFDYSATNITRRSQTARIDITHEMSFATDLAALAPLLANNFDFATSTGKLTYTGFQSRVFGPSAQNANQSIDLGSILGSLQFAGTGDFSLTCETVSGLVAVGGGGNININQNTTGGCGARITYVYDAAIPPVNNVPEPGSLALVGLALTGMGLARRKKK